MKVLQFTVPIVQEGSVVIQEDILPQFYNYFHRHTEAQITLIIKGEGTLIAGNYTQPFKAGDVYLIGANQPHIFKGDIKYIAQKKVNNIHAIHIYFDTERILRSILGLPELEAVRKFIRHTQQGLQLPTDFAASVSRNIREINRANDFERLIRFIRLLHFLANEVKDWKSLSTGFSKHSFSDSEGLRMNDIYQYTIEHHAENISLKKVADVAHISLHAFCKYFKKHTRKTYMNFLNEIRINEGCKKIINGNFDSIASVAYSVGFNNAITFNRAFKKFTGMTPTRYMGAYKRR
jgi:AraC-like DNA-binding protein